MKYTIKDLAEGRVAVRNDGTLEELREVLKLAFPDDTPNPTGGCKLYREYRNKGEWIGAESTRLPIQSVKDFLKQERIRDFNEKNLESIVKYIARYKHKNGLEDLKKAQVYLQRLIDRYEKS